jgi:hypothetical protein
VAAKTLAIFNLESAAKILLSFGLGFRLGLGCGMSHPRNPLAEVRQR